MLVEPDRAKRHRLFEYVPKPLEAFVGPGHILRQIDEGTDFQAIAAPLEAAYDPDLGRPAIRPEVLVRALVLSYAYRILLCAGFVPRYGRTSLFVGAREPQMIDTFSGENAWPGGERT